MADMHAGKYDLTRGNVTKTMLSFAWPFILGNLFQQLYNITDTMIVGRFLGTGSLAAVGAAYTLMTFITSVIIGLCLGCGTIFSHLSGAGDYSKLRRCIYISFASIGLFSILLNAASSAFITPILHFINIPDDILGITEDYTLIVTFGIVFIFIYNFYTSLLRSIGNSAVPLIFLIISVVLNIGLDLLFIVSFNRGIKGAALATVISQAVAAAGLALWTWRKASHLLPARKDMKFDMGMMKEILSYSFLTCTQQSVMNFGILMVQGLVNSFGTAVMAAFSAAVKIDSFAYMPVQDFGNAFSTFIAQNFGAGRNDRIRQGITRAITITILFSLSVSALVVIFARPLMLMFVSPAETEILGIGMNYLYIEGSFYIGIGVLFLLYGLFRAIGKPEVSLYLTIISLGLRVALAYLLSATALGENGIWWSIPIGWFVADLTGIIWYKAAKRKSGINFNQNKSRQDGEL